MTFNFTEFKNRVSSYKEYIICECSSLKACCFQRILFDENKAEANCPYRFKDDDEYRSCCLFSKLTSLK